MALAILHQSYFILIFEEEVNHCSPSYIDWKLDSQAYSFQEDLIEDLLQ